MFAVMQRKFLLIVLPLALTGCLAQSQIQGKYMHSQEDCRNQTQQMFADTQTVPKGEQGQAAVATGFSDCMQKQGWHLAGKPATPPVAAANPPTGAPSTNPSAATIVPVRQVPAQNPQVRAAPVQAAPAVAPRPLAPTTAPASVPAPAATATKAPAVAATSPDPAPSAGTAPLSFPTGRPEGVFEPSYGTGGGRNF